MSRAASSGPPNGLDRGLADAVERFVGGVGSALIEAAQGTTVDAKRLQRDATVEAFNLVAACIDADQRHTDDELWALVAAFSPHDLLPVEATPPALRQASLLAGRRSWMHQPSELLRTLADVDRRQGSLLARRYYDEAMALSHMVASLDQYPSTDELSAIVAFQRLLLGALPAPPVPAPPTAAPTPPIAAPELSPAEPLEDLLAELDTLIGLAAVKEEVRLLTALLRVQRLRQERGLPVVESTRHLVFSGNPGTGKTTVARLLARIYHRLGVVERGHLTEVDRAGLVAGYVGQTATKVGEVFAAADGGVLLIDEAYSLIRGGEKDFGREAIDAIVKQVEDRRDSLVVILAGYPKEMAELVAANPGFSSRFPKTILFPDYSDDELLSILDLITAASGYRLADEARKAASAWFGAHPRGHGFGNGRLARNLFEGAIARQAQRLMDVEQPTDDQLTVLEVQDLVTVPVGGVS